jgi:hypothetical protein
VFFESRIPVVSLIVLHIHLPCKRWTLVESQEIQFYPFPKIKRLSSELILFPVIIDAEEKRLVERRFLSFIGYTVYTYVCIAVLTLDAGLLARSQYSEGPATGHPDTGFSWFPCVYKRMLRWFPSFQVATTCLSCSPPDLNSLFTFFCIFVYM